jgi:hypothetical protein
MYNIETKGHLYHNVIDIYKWVVDSNYLVLEFKDGKLTIIPSVSVERIIKD